jgi:Skp family chaperone for outer membrane proteins
MSVLSMTARVALAGLLSMVLAGAALTGALTQSARAADKPAETKTGDVKAAAPAGSPTGPVFIVIDPDRIRKESLAGKSLNAEAEKYGKQIDEENRKDESSFRVEEQEFQKQRGTLPQDQLTSRGRALEQRYGEVQRTELRRRQAFEKSFNMAMIKWQQAMMDASRDVAASHNADAVVQSQALLFYNTKWDVTNEIIDLMNKRVSKIDFPPPKLEPETGAAAGGAKDKQLQPSPQLQAQPQPSGGLKLPQQ